MAKKVDRVVKNTITGDSVFYVSGIPGEVEKLRYTFYSHVYQGTNYLGGRDWQAQRDWWGAKDSWHEGDAIALVVDKEIAARLEGRCEIVIGTPAERAIHFSFMWPPEEQLPITRPEGVNSIPVYDASGIINEPAWHSPAPEKTPQPVPVDSQGVEDEVKVDHQEEPEQAAVPDGAIPNREDVEPTVAVVLNDEGKHFSPVAKGEALRQGDPSFQADDDKGSEPEKDIRSTGYIKIVILLFVLVLFLLMFIAYVVVVKQGGVQGLISPSHDGGRVTDVEVGGSTNRSDGGALGSDRSAGAAEGERRHMEVTAQPPPSHEGGWGAGQNQGATLVPPPSQFPVEDRAELLQTKSSMERDSEVEPEGMNEDAALVPVGDSITSGSSSAPEQMMNDESSAGQADRGSGLQDAEQSAAEGVEGPADETIPFNYRTQVNDRPEPRSEPEPGMEPMPEPEPEPLPVAPSGSEEDGSCPGEYHLLDLC